METHYEIYINTQPWSRGATAAIEPRAVQQRLTCVRAHAKWARLPENRLDGSSMMEPHLVAHSSAGHSGRTRFPRDLPILRSCLISVNPLSTLTAAFLR